MKKDKFVNKDRSSFGNSYRKTLSRPVEQGNIDLNNRPVIHNRDGSISTLDSISIGENGREVLIPTIVNGKKVSDNDAINHYRKTGEHLGKFDSVDTANTYARALHETQARKYQNTQTTPSPEMQRDGGYIQAYRNSIKKRKK